MKQWLSMACLVSSVVGTASVKDLHAGPSVPSFRAVEVDSEVGIGYGVAVVDIDGDRRSDIVLVDKAVISWYRNPTWQKFVIAKSLTEKDHVCIAARDIDGDGKAELAAGAGWNPSDTLTSGSVHYLHASAERTERWETIDLPQEPTVHRMRWLRGAQGAFQLVVAPLHGRGNEGGRGQGVKILAYHKPADPRAAWQAELIDGTLHMTHNIDPVEWDDDPEEELLVVGREGLFLFDRRADGWWRRQLGRGEGNGDFYGGSEARLGRLPGGRRFIATVEPFHGNQVVVYTEPSAASGEFWQRRVIDRSLKGGHAVACGDVAKRGHDQVVVGWRLPDADGKVGVRLYLPQDSDGKDWRAVLVDDNTMACEDLCLADLNGDGRLDVVAAGRATNNLKIYWNEK